MRQDAAGAVDEKAGRETRMRRGSKEYGFNTAFFSRPQLYGLAEIVSFAGTSFQLAMS